MEVQGTGGVPRLGEILANSRLCLSNRLDKLFQSVGYVSVFSFRSAERSLKRIHVFVQRMFVYYQVFDDNRHH